MRFLIKFSYDGTNYNGFQKQPHKETIEEKLEDNKKNWWLVGTIGHHVRQSLNKIVTFVRENFARFNNR